MMDLINRCLKEMLTHISSSTVCSFHQVSCKVTIIVVVVVAVVIKL